MMPAHTEPYGPAYLTTSADEALSAWHADADQWIVTNETAYLVGYPTAWPPCVASVTFGWRLTSPEELEGLDLEP